MAGNGESGRHSTRYAAGALWVDGAFYFNSSMKARKAKNLEQNQHCILTVATHDFDLIFEGKAERVTDPATVQCIAPMVDAG